MLTNATDEGRGGLALLGLAAVLLPLVIGTALTVACRGQLLTAQGRCRRRRVGIARHCADHRGWNLYDSLALLSYATAVIVALNVVPWLAFGASG